MSIKFYEKYKLKKIRHEISPDSAEIAGPFDTLKKGFPCPEIYRTI